MSASTYLENKLLDHITGKTSFTKPTSYVALFTTNPDEDASGTECSGGSYARVTTSGSDWDAAASGSVSNAQDIEFPEATGAWGTVTHFAMFDAATSGNMLVYAELTVSKAVTTGDTPKFAAGDLTITAS